MVIVVSVHPMNVQHMERYVLIYKLVISIHLYSAQHVRGKPGAPGPIGPYVRKNCLALCKAKFIKFYTSVGI